MSDLVEKRRKEWRSRAIRHLLELEREAQQMRHELEDGPDVNLSGLDDRVADLCSHTMSITTYVDKCAALSEVGL